MKHMIHPFDGFQRPFDGTPFHTTEVEAAMVRIKLGRVVTDVLATYPLDVNELPDGKRLKLIAGEREESLLVVAEAVEVKGQPVKGLRVVHIGAMVEDDAPVRASAYYHERGSRDVIRMDTADMVTEAAFRERYGGGPDMAAARLERDMHLNTLPIGLNEMSKLTTIVRAARPYA
jgi:hypothetical protein